MMGQTTPLCLYTFMIGQKMTSSTEAPLSVCGSVCVQCLQIKKTCHSYKHLLSRRIYECFYVSHTHLIPFLHILYVVFRNVT